MKHYGQESANLYGRIRICRSFIDADAKKVLNIGAGQVLWIENDLFRGKKGLVSSDIEEKNLGESNLCRTKIRMDATKMQFKDKSFDEVIILDVLEHIKDDEKALSEINRVLKKRGLLVISVPNDSLLSLLNPVRHTQHERHYSPEDIVKKLKAHGFEIEKIFIGGFVIELINLYIHFFMKYGFRVFLHSTFLDPIIDRIEYSKSRKFGSEIMIRAIKS